MSLNLKKLLTDESWSKILENEFQKPYFNSLEQKLDQAYNTKTVYPPKELIFSAFNLISFEKVKVVILGQDPYHGANQAHGLCFSVQPEVKNPPSLKNIYKEIESDLNIKMPSHGYLKAWAEQGVLMLNSILTVEEGKPMSHKNFGWEQFTDHVIDLINEKNKNVVFMLWGSPAHLKAKNVDSKKHLVLKSVHPSPLSSYRGFFGCKHFSQCNSFLLSKGIKPIEWQI
jgi:uracil-DNA glycosylase